MAVDAPLVRWLGAKSDHGLPQDRNTMPAFPEDLNKQVREGIAHAFFGRKILESHGSEGEGVCTLSLSF